MIGSAGQHDEVVRRRRGKPPDIVLAAIDMMEDLGCKDAACLFLVLEPRGYLLPGKLERHAHRFQRFRIVDA